ncbi:MAG TPA: caspase family protein [Gemmataceae bacterium]|nr:caspase family protein [Gemmataceae bacterium]
MGTATHTDASLSSLPQVADNLTDLAEALTAGPDPVVAPGSVDVLVDAWHPGDVLERIARQPPSRRILFYYAGHGMSQGQRLYLALPGSQDDEVHRARTGLPIAAVLKQLTIAPPQRRQAVVILDCCYAGLAAREEDAADVHLLMAVGKAHKAKYDVGGRNTFFTAALLRLLRQGIPGGAPYLDLGTIYRALAAELGHVDGMTGRPHQRTVDASAVIPLAVNPGAGVTRTAAALERRARMAQDIGMAGAPDAAAQLFAEIVRDAGQVPGVERANAFRYAAAEAAWRGRAGQTTAAAHALTELLSGDLGDCREADIEEARASLAYWTRRSAANAQAGPCV